MTSLSVRLSLLAATVLAIATWLVVPWGLAAGRSLSAEDDPARIADLALEKSFNAAVAQREITAALAAHDVDLAQSFVALAAERGVVVDPILAASVEAAGTGSAQTGRGVGQFIRGFVVGEPDDLASLAGTATGDLFVYGDARDAVREGWRLARGEPADELILGLACVGLVVTAGTYASLGAGAPARVGLSVFKAARRTGRIGAGLSGAIVRAARESVDTVALRNAFTLTALLRPALAMRAAREAVKVDKAGGLMHLARDAGRMQSHAGTRAALDGLKAAESPKDVARFARLAEAKGIRTRAVIKLLGRGAIWLGVGLWSLASWVFAALLNLLWLVVALKRTVERATLAHIRKRKLRRAAMPPPRLAPAAVAA
jgi:hypothetical protein